MKLLLILTAVYAICCPYTKVEESFNLQAVHDILTYGSMGNPVAIHSHYDHMQYPGAVPRTFIGPLLIATVVKPLSSLLTLGGFIELTGAQTQTLVRLTLALFNCWVLIWLRRQIAFKYGKSAGLWFAGLLCAQFHLLYYASRTLPNFIALPFVLLALGHWIREDGRMNGTVCGWLIFAGIVFRAELVVLFVPMALMDFLLAYQLAGSSGLVKRFRGLLVSSLLSATVSLALTVVVDSWFWQRWVYPEGEGLYFNAYLNQSHLWGTSPFHWYFTTQLPKLLGISWPLFWYAIWVDWRLGCARIVRLSITLLGFVLLYSFLPHKEWRFIVYIVPLLTAFAAVGADQIWKNRQKNRWHTLMAWGVIAGIVLQLCSSFTMVYISSWNYPGGVALQRLHELVDTNGTKVNVHIDAESAMSGISLFGEQNRPRWRYSKNEMHKVPSDYDPYTHLITANPTFHGEDGRRFTVLDVIYGFDRIQFRVGRQQRRKDRTETVAADFWVAKIILVPKIYLMQSIINN